MRLRRWPVDIDALDPAGRVRMLAQLEAQAGWLAGLTARVLVAVAADHGGAGGEWEREQVRVAQSVGAWEAGRRLDTARALRDWLPATRIALNSGRISWGHAVVMAGETRGLDEMQTARVERAVLADARLVTVPQWRRAIGRLVAALVPAKTEYDFALARASRRLVAWHERDRPGVGGLSGTFPDADLCTTTLALDALAVRSGPEDLRDIDTRRADALVELCAAHLNAGTLPADAGVRPHVVIHLHDDGLGPVPTVGEMPIAPSAVERYGCDASIQHVRHDPNTGAVTDLGRTGRFPDTRLRRALQLRDRHCTFPGCIRTHHLHAHHLEHWAHGGPTDQHNLTLLCHRHHNAIHDAGWHASRAFNGALIWTNHHRKQQHPPPGDWRPDPDPPWHSPRPPRPGEARAAEAAIDLETEPPF